MTEKPKAIETQSIGKAQRQLNCFIIMPFSEAKFVDTDGVEQTLNEHELKHIYKELFVKAVSNYNNYGVSFENVHRSETPRGNFVTDIVGRLQKYDLVLADLTGLNPNVFYELGIRNTFTNGTIMVTQNRESIPSDLRNHIGIDYKFHKNTVDFTNYYPTFKQALHRCIDDFIKEPDKSDNPVRDYIGNRVIFRNEERIKDIEGNIQVMGLLRNKYLETMCYHRGIIHQWAQGKDVKIIDVGIEGVIKPFLSKLIITNESFHLVDFLSSLLNSFKIFYNAIVAAKINIMGAKKIEVARNTHLSFKGLDRNNHHLLDLIDFYKTSIDQDDDVFGHMKFDNKDDVLYILKPEPILSAFNHFMAEWKKELEHLTK